jgi:hypothetical protein
MPRPLLLCITFASFALLIAGRAPAADPASQPASQPTEARTGHFQLTFTEKSPQSDTPSIVKRMGWRLEPLKEFGQPMDYDPAKESYEVYVPASYTGTEPYGLFVWVSPGPRGNMPDQFYESLDRHRLIAIGANNGGNNRVLWNRMSLALDAPHNMRSRYSIDSRRVYVSGASGGGRTASRLAILYPEVFHGGFYQIGVDYFRPLEVEKGSNKFYKQAFQKSPRDVFPFARDRSRHVLLTGETDANRVQTKLTYDAMGKDGFKHVTYLEQPGLGHQPPNAEWFEKGIVALDTGFGAEEAEKASPEKAAPAKTRVIAKRPAASAKEPPPPSDAADEAARLLRSAKPYIESGLYEQARERLEKVVSTYPNSPSAAEARKLLVEIKGKTK